MAVLDERLQERTATRLDGELREALSPALAARRSGSTWSSPSSGQVEAIGGQLGPASADRRGHPRGEPAREDRDDRRRRPPRALRAGPRREDRRHRDRYRPRSDRYLLTVHDGGVGCPRRANHVHGDGLAAILRQGSGPPALGALGRHRRRLFPVRGRARRRDRRRPGPDRPRDHAGGAGAALRPEARAPRGPPCVRPDPRGVQSADQPRRRAHQPG